MEALPSLRRLQSTIPEREAAEGQTEAPGLDPAKPRQQQLLLRPLTPSQNILFKDENQTRTSS